MHSLNTQSTTQSITTTPHDLVFGQKAATHVMDLPSISSEQFVHNVANLLPNDAIGALKAHDDLENVTEF